MRAENHCAAPKACDDPQQFDYLELELLGGQASATMTILAQSMRAALAVDTTGDALQDHSAAVCGVQRHLRDMRVMAGDAGQHRLAESIEELEALANTVADLAISNRLRQRQALMLADLLNERIRSVMSQPLEDVQPVHACAACSPSAQPAS
jgi:hypothetical protein